MQVYMPEEKSSAFFAGKITGVAMPALPTRIIFTVDGKRSFPTGFIHEILTTQIIF